MWLLEMSVLIEKGRYILWKIIQNESFPLAMSAETYIGYYYSLLEIMPKIS